MKKKQRVEKCMPTLNTPITNTWCPGCPNFLILSSFKNALCNLMEEGVKKEDFVIVTDIGCNGKIYDYVDVSGFNTLHGRTLPTSFGIKCGNPKLKVIGFIGDGGAYNEGLSHFVNACRYNMDMTLIVHNNQIFSLTAGQASNVTEKGFVEKTHPLGVKERPLNPMVLALESGATFVSRISALDIVEMQRVIKEAIKHKGFSVVEIMQPCIVFHKFSDFLKTSSYKVKEMDKEEAIQEAKKWNYTHDGKIGLGIFHKRDEKTFEERNLDWKK
jgi:2-oxoglutarate ferredoxin oxidoreductase subunit beta